MKKIYKSPVTDIVEIKIRNGILINASQVSDGGTTNPGGGYGGDSPDNENDLSRVDNTDNNRGSIWDNAW